MSNKFLCVMAGYDSKTEKYLSGIQQKLYSCGYVGEETKNLPQHITLGTFPVEAEDEAVERVKAVAKDTESFEITFNHVGVFQGSRVLFIAPDTNTELLKLKENFGDAFGWTAHTTMIIDEEDKILKAMPIVLSEFVSCRGRVTSLHLYEFFPARHILTVDLPEDRY